MNPLSIALTILPMLPDLVKLGSDVIDKHDSAWAPDLVNIALDLHVNGHAISAAEAFGSLVLAGVNAWRHSNQLSVLDFGLSQASALSTASSAPVVANITQINNGDGQPGLEQ
jgi:hypothetical protein